MTHRFLAIVSLIFVILLAQSSCNNNTIGGVDVPAEVRESVHHWLDVHDKIEARNKKIRIERKNIKIDCAEFQIVNNRELEGLPEWCIHLSFLQRETSNSSDNTSDWVEHHVPVISMQVLSDWSATSLPCKCEGRRLDTE